MSKEDQPGLKTTIAGVLLVGYAMLFMDTTVDGYYNIGLQQRQNHFLILGLFLVAVGYYRKSTAKKRDAEDIRDADCGAAEDPSERGQVTAVNTGRSYVPLAQPAESERSITPPTAPIESQLPLRAPPVAKPWSSNRWLRKGIPRTDDQILRVLIGITVGITTVIPIVTLASLLIELALSKSASTFDFSINLALLISVSITIVYFRFFATTDRRIAGTLLVNFVLQTLLALLSLSILATGEDNAAFGFFAFLNATLAIGSMYIRRKLLSQ